MNMLFLGLAFAAGILMAVQGTINGLLGKFIGVLEGNFLVHAIGLAAVSVLLFVFQMGKGDWSRITEAPWYAYTGGLINVAIIFGVMATIPKIDRLTPLRYYCRPGRDCNVIRFIWSFWFGKGSVELVAFSRDRSFDIRWPIDVTEIVY